LAKPDREEESVTSVSALPCVDIEDRAHVEERAIEAIYYEEDLQRGEARWGGRGHTAGARSAATPDEG
jgi:hypothetical protein